MLHKLIDQNCREAAQIRASLSKLKPHRHNADVGRSIGALEKQLSDADTAIKILKAHA